jgi:hypothetical protein
MKLAADLYRVLLSGDMRSLACQCAIGISLEAVLSLMAGTD